jgi:Restriction endonuclease BglII
VRTVTFDFRHAADILARREAWTELHDTLASIADTDILAVHGELSDRRAGVGQRAPAGGQSALNELMRRRLVALGWEKEPRLFDGEGLRKWKMDFLKEGIGVEVSFNHQEAIAWTLTRLNVAGESEAVLEEHRIDVGVAMYPSDALKRWCRMDNAVGTFDTAEAWLSVMKPILPIPILLVGLDVDDWVETDAFRGTMMGTRTKLQ